MSTETSNKEFGKALKQIWNMLRGLEEKKIADIKNELYFEMLERGLLDKVEKRRRNRNPSLDTTGSNTLDFWGKGHVPADDEIVEFLAEVGVRRAKLTPEWLERFLKSARFSSARRKERTLALFPQGGLNTSRHVLLPLRLSSLPNRDPHFLGRKSDMGRIQRALESDTRIIFIYGLPGIGKTSLVKEIAYACAGEPSELAKQFLWSQSEFVFWMSAESNLSLDEFLVNMISALGSSVSFTGGPQDRPNHIKGLLDGKSAVIVVDNFHRISGDRATSEFLATLPERVKVLLVTQERNHLSQILKDCNPLWIPVRRLHDSDSLALMRQEARRMMDIREGDDRMAERKRLGEIIDTSDEVIMEIISALDGIPQLMKLALTVIAEQALPLNAFVDQLHVQGPDVNALYNYLYGPVWERCDDAARAVWRVLPLFPTPCQRQALLVISRLETSAFDHALKDLLGRELLEVEEGADEPRYSTHSTARAFIEQMPDWKTPGFLDQLRDGWAAYYIDLTERILKREDRPVEPYWNTLASMQTLARFDPEWPNARRVLEWVDRQHDDEKLVRLTKLIVHYLDRRILFDERLKNTKKAIEAAHRLGRSKDEGQLLIDACGWILIEEERFHEAEQCITNGLDIISTLHDKGEDPEGWTAIGYAWLARLYLLCKGKYTPLRTKYSHDPANLIQIARSIQPCIPVIQSRVSMIAGDIERENGNNEKAIEYHREAVIASQDYCSVGEGFEFMYRLGKSYLKAGRIDEAKVAFEKIVEIDPLVTTIETIHAKYGLAQVAEKQADIQNAKLWLREAINILQERNPRHGLLSEMKELNANLAKSE